MSSIILSANHVAKHYGQGKNQVDVLKDVSMAVVQGSTSAIVGVSGAGKSTLLNILGGLDTCSEGYVELAGQRLDATDAKALAKLRNRYLGFVYQSHHLLKEFDAKENVAMALLIRGLSKQQAFAKAKVMLAAVGLEHRFDHRPQQLSGGERQRVAIARALVGEPACVLMDEPTGNLDQQTAEHIQQLLQQLNRQLGIAFVIVTHDNSIAQQQQQVFRLDNGELYLQQPKMQS